MGMAGIPWGRIWSDDGGLLVRLEPGLSGGKLHVGFRSAFSILFFPAVASDICGSVLYGSVLYTWNDPWGGLENDQTYLGTEFRATAVPLVLSFGLYGHVAGNDDEHDWLFSAGGGIGF
ncbi:MAG: hypothetical protein AVO35_06110 [Candidatus Aegiribacteria sp. MLS_C]|nr:MAG: hypothetical protein AVO35_06110 [Candidatus Aegiribacteria sp. MLS_C]